jgi:inorganic pyrophosphatase
MLRVIFFAVAVSAAFAQLSSTREPAQRDEFLTGGAEEYRKVIKGDLRQDPAEFLTYIEEAAEKKPLSYWNDIPLYFDEAERVYNMIVEIPRGEAIKTLLNISEELSPITVSMLPNSNQPALENVDYIHDFGKLPQTYSSASVEDKLAKLNGNGYPLDVVEISDRTHQIGDIVPVKILGVLGVASNNIVDYKLIAFDIRSAAADQINSLADIESHYPDLLAATRGYFRFYQFPQQVNDMLFNGEYQDASVAENLIKEKHNEWKQLLENANPPAEVNTVSRQSFAKFQPDQSKWQMTLDA